MHGVDSFQPIPIADNYLLLITDTDKIAINITLLYFKKKLITFSLLCTPEGKKG